MVGLPVKTRSTYPPNGSTRRVTTTMNNRYWAALYGSTGLVQQQTQSKAGRLIGLTDRSMRRYIAGDVAVPRSVEYALRYVIEHGIQEEAAK